MATHNLTGPDAMESRIGDTPDIHYPHEGDGMVGERKEHVTIPQVSQVVIVEDSPPDPAAMAVLLAEGTEVCFPSPSGQLQGRLSPPLSGNGPLRIAQHEASRDSVRSFVLARAFAHGKLTNLCAVLRNGRHSPDDECIPTAIAHILHIRARIGDLQPDVTGPTDTMHPPRESARESLQTLERAASSLYFAAFAGLLKDDPGFRGRCPLPSDPVNTLLSFGYGLLVSWVEFRAERRRPGPVHRLFASVATRKARTCLRPCWGSSVRPIVDSVVLALLNGERLSKHDFCEELGSWLLTERGCRSVLFEFEERLDTEVRHPVFGYRASFRHCIELEARLVAKWLAGEILTYEPVRTALTCAAIDRFGGNLRRLLRSPQHRRAKLSL